MEKVTFAKLAKDISLVPAKLNQKCHQFVLKMAWKSVFNQTVSNN